MAMDLAGSMKVGNTRQAVAGRMTPLTCQAISEPMR